MIKKKLILIFFSVGWFSFSSAVPGNYNSITGRLSPFIKNSLAAARIPNSPYGSLYLDEREARQGFVGQRDHAVPHLRVVHQNIVEICRHWERKGKSKQRLSKTT